MSWKKCPRCGGENIECIDSRWNGTLTRRRYGCLKRGCGMRFTTAEEIVAGKKGHARGMGRSVKLPSHAMKDKLMARIDRMLQRELP